MGHKAMLLMEQIYCNSNKKLYHSNKFVIITRLIVISSILGGNGESALHGPIEEIAWKEAEEAESLLHDLGIAVRFLSFLV
jgi:hypothetical protein